MRKIIEEPDPRMKVEILVSKDRLLITRLDGVEERILVDMESNEIRPIIDAIASLIDEDLPGMKYKMEWIDDYEVSINCSMLTKPMILHERNKQEE